MVQLAAERSSALARASDRLSERVAALVLSSCSETELAAILAEEALRLWGGERAVLWTYEPTLGRIFARQPHREPRSLDLSEAGARQLLDHVALVRGERSAREALLLDASLGLAGSERDEPDVLLVPLRLGGDEPVGLLLVEEPAVRELEAARALVAPFARQAAAALANHRALADGRRHEAQLEALYRTAGELSSELDLGQVLDAIVDRARALASAPIGYVMLVDPARGEIAMNAVAGVTSEEFRAIRLDIGAGLGGLAAAEGHPFYTSDYLNDGRFRHRRPVDEQVRAVGIKSILGVPMRARDELVGVLYVADRAVRVFSAGDVEVLVSLAQHAALAIHTARLYEHATAALTQTSRTTELLAQQNEQLRRVDDAQRQLSEVALAAEGLEGIVALVADLAGAPVVVLDEHHRPLASAGEPSDAFGARLAQEGIAPEQRRAAAIAKVLSSISGSAATVLEPHAPERPAARLVVPVVGRGEVLASVWVECPPERIGDERPLVEQGARVVALELLKERSVAEVARRQRWELLDDLLAERPPARDALQRRALGLGLDLRVAHALVVATALEAPADGRRGGAEEAVGDARDALVGALRGQPWCTFVAEHSGHVVALVPGDGPAAADRLTRAVRQLGRRGRTLRAIVSPACEEPAGYRAAFDGARRALSLLADAMADPVAELEEMRVLTLLFRRGGTGELRAFVDSRLGPLERQAADGRTDLVGTLEAYLACGGSPARTAARLDVHVNTVYYRLDRLRTLLGDDFAQPRRALDLQVACLARRILVGKLQ
jgi:GAF domain-containing protein